LNENLTVPTQHPCRVGRLFLAWLLLNVCALLASEQPAPLFAAQKEEYLKLLHPADATLLGMEVTKTDADSGVVLLSEQIVLVDEQGRRSILLHWAMKGLSDAGTKECAQRSIGFRKHDQKIHLLIAETIQPDGSRQPIKEEGIIIHSPQNQADVGIYDDLAELRLVFPGVRTGSVIHLAVVIHDEVSRFPGEFTRNLTYGAYWPIGILKHQVIVPASIEDRLKVHVMGSGFPEDKIERLPNGRSSHTWLFNQLPAQAYEQNSPPWDQVGPCLGLTTLDSWDQVAAWFQNLRKDRSKLGPVLAAKVDEWTKTAGSPDEIIRILHSKVSEEIRYVGLEFGMADYQPHDCNAVWENQYGDCKDKANLLIAMLTHKGIEAYPALLISQSIGLVNRECPDFRAFDHMIVAIPGHGSGFLLCDPTLKHSAPGQVPPGDVNRDLLVLQQDKAVWHHSDPQGTSGTHLRFDVKVSKAATLSGSLEIDASGSLAVMRREHWLNMDETDARQYSSNYLRAFLPAAEMVDLQRPPLSEKPTLYFHVPAPKLSEDGRIQLHFPSPKDLMSGLGVRGERTRPYYAPAVAFDITVSFQAPEGYEVATLPHPFRFDSPAATGEASWSEENGRIIGRMHLQARKSEINPDEFAPYFRGAQALSAWLGEPAALQKSPATAARRQATEAVELPVMPTGNGQLGVVDKLYPENSDSGKRRLALEQTARLFPDDHNTQLRVSVRLAVLDWAQDHARAEAMLADALGRHGRESTPEALAWSLRVDGLMLRDLGRLPEAARQFSTIIENPQVRGDSKAEAACLFAGIRLSRDTASTLDLLERVYALQGGATAEVLAARLHALLLLNRDEECRPLLERFHAAKARERGKPFRTLLGELQGWTLPGDPERRKLLLDLVATLPAGQDAELREFLESLRESNQLEVIKERIRADLGRKPLSDWCHRDELPALTTKAEFESAYAEAASANQLPRCLGLALLGITTAETTEEAIGRLSLAIDAAESFDEKDASRPGPEVVDYLVEACNSFPKSSAGYVSGRLLRAARLQQMNEEVKAMEVLASIAGDKETPPGLLPLIAESYVPLLIRHGRLEDACKVLGAAVESPEDSASRGQCLWNAALLNLHLGRDEEALRLLGLLGKLDYLQDESFSAKTQASQLIAFAKQPCCRDFWKASRKWWPDYETLCSKAAAERTVLNEVLPEIPDVDKLIDEMVKAMKEENRKQYFADFALIMSAARWSPEIGHVIGDRMPRAFSPSENATAQLVATMLSYPLPDDVPESYERKAFLAGVLIDMDDYEGALKVIHALPTLHPKASNIARYIHRRYGYAANQTGKDLDQAAELIRQDLRSSDYVWAREKGVNILADILHRQGALAAEQALLREEIRTSCFAGKKQILQPMQTRLESLSEKIPFGNSLAALRTKLGLDWLDQIDPANLKDPRVQDPEAQMTDEDGVFNYSQRVKLAWLVAEDTERPLASRTKGLNSAMTDLLWRLPDSEAMVHMVETVLSDPAVEDKTKNDLLDNALFYLASESFADEYTRLRKHPLALASDPKRLETWARRDFLADQDLSTPAKTQALAMKVLAGARDYLSERHISDLFDRLLTQGALDEAQAIADQIPAWNPSEKESTRLRTLRADYSRKVRLARELHPVHEALRQVLVERLGPLPEKAPGALRTWRMALGRSPCRHDKDTLDYDLYLVRTRQFPRDEFKFWQELLTELSLGHPENNNLLSEMFRRALAASDDDQLHDKLYRVFDTSTDMDLPPLQGSFMELMRKDSLKGEKPLSRKTYIALKYHHMIEDGTAPDPADFLQVLNTGTHKAIRNRLCILGYLARNDQKSLRHLINTLDVTELIETRSTRAAYFAYENLGMKEELSLIREDLLREMKKEMANAYVWGRVRDFAAVEGILHLLDDPDCVPRQWLLYAQTRDPSMRGRALARFWLARKDHDNKAAEEALLAIERMEPTYFDISILHAKLLLGMGRKKEAIPYLKTTIKHRCAYAQGLKAQELLKSLK